MVFTQSEIPCEDVHRRLPTVADHSIITLQLQAFEPPVLRIVCAAGFILHLDVEAVIAAAGADPAHPF